MIKIIKRNNFTCQLMHTCCSFLTMGAMADTLWSSLSHPLTVTCSGGNPCVYPASLNDGGFNNHISSNKEDAASGLTGIDDGSQEFVIDLTSLVIFVLRWKVFY